MRLNNKEIEKYRDTHKEAAFFKGKGNSRNGFFNIPSPITGEMIHVFASDQMGWEHISIAIYDRRPTLEEIQFIRDLFFKKDEIVIQYHITSTNKRIHLWRPIGKDFPVPTLINSLINPAE